MATTACQFCGFQNAAGRSSCVNCGAPMPAAAPARPRAVQPQFRPHDPPRQLRMSPIGGRPPKRGKTSLFVGIGVVVAGLVVFLVTGFAAPGFLKSDSSEPRKPAASAAVKKRFSDEFIAAVNDGNSNSVMRLFCERSKSGSAQLLAKMNAKVLPKNAVSQNTLAFDITVHGVADPIPSAELKPRGSSWCIDKFEFMAPDAPVSKIKSELRAIRQSLKEGKVETISRKLCPEVPEISAKLKGLIRTNKGQIKVDDPIDLNGKIYQGNARMTLSDYDGETVGNGFLVLDSIDAGHSWCVSEFRMDYR